MFYDRHEVRQYVYIFPTPNAVASLTHGVVTFHTVGIVKLSKTHASLSINWCAPKFCNIEIASLRFYFTKTKVAAYGYLQRILLIVAFFFWLPRFEGSRQNS